MRVFGCIFLVILCVSCGDIKPQETSAYFSIDSLLNSQTVILLEGQQKLQKLAIVNGDSATSILAPDSLEWANEFQLFRDLNVNEPALIGRYKISEREDLNSNLKVMSYQALEDELEIKSFDIYYLKNISDVKIITAQSKSKNSIFESEKNIRLEFDKENEDLQLKSYTSKGFQKMILQDSVVYEVRGKIIN